jgi:hypothetical protein
MGSKLGFLAYADIVEDSIETDISLLPFTDIISERVVRVPDKIVPQYYLKTPNYANAKIIFRKAAKTTLYTRSFNKIDSYFSYVGGLVGTIIGLIFIMGPYTDKAFELSLAKKVLVSNERKEIPSESFNLAYFLLAYVKRFLNKIRAKVDWPMTQIFIDSSQ